MTAIMYDTQYPSIVPRNAELVVCYPDGNIGNSYSKAVAIFGSRAHSITWTGVNADMADVEIWSSFPEAKLAAWVKAQQARGVPRPVIYTPLFQWEHAKALVSGLVVSWWVPDWTGKPHAIKGADAVQYGAQAHPGGPMITDPTKAAGQTYDLSLVQPSFPFYPNQWPLREGITGILVKNLQTFLNKRSMGAGTPDGVFGPNTKKAVVKAQVAYHQRGVEAGICNKDLYAKLEYEGP